MRRPSQVVGNIVNASSPPSPSPRQIVAGVVAVSHRRALLSR